MTCVLINVLNVTIGEESLSGNGSQGDGDIQDNIVPTIWTLSCKDNLVVAGCANGRIEVRSSPCLMHVYVYHSTQSYLGVQECLNIDKTDKHILLILQTHEISLHKNNSHDLHRVITHSLVLVILLCTM